MGLDRSALLRESGVTVVTLPFEIHPELPVGGISLAERWGARYAEASEMYTRIEAECEAAGLPFRRPERVPNTRRALETAEWVRRHAPEAFDALELALFQAHFVDNRPLDDPDVVDELVAATGADAAEGRRAVDNGEARADVESAMATGASIGVQATPTWLIDRRVLIPGAMPREVFGSVLSRLEGEPA